MKRSNWIIGGVIFSIIAMLASLIVYDIAWNRKFMTVHAGMTKENVQGLMGPPPKILPNSGGETWDYTRSWSYDSRVYFNNDGIVKWVETD